MYKKIALFFLFLFVIVGCTKKDTLKENINTLIEEDKNIFDCSSSEKPVVAITIGIFLLVANSKIFINNFITYIFYLLKKNWLKVKL